MCDAELRREIGEPRADDGAPVRVRRHGDGEAGRRGAELLVRRRRLLLLFDRRGRGRRGARCTITTPSCRGGCRRRSSSRPATAWCSGSTCACGPRGATARCATRSPRPRRTTRPSAGPGSGRPGCARGPAPGDRALGDELLAMLEPFIYPRSVDPRMIDDVRALRALFRDPADAARRAGRDGLRRQAGRGRHPRRRDGGAGAAAAARRQAPRPARAQHAARVAAAGRRRPAQRSRGVDAAVGVPLLAPARAPRPGRDGRADATGSRATTTARARFAAGLGFPDARRRSTPRCGASARRSRRSPRRWATPPAELHLEAARLLNPLRDRDELERLAAAAGFRDPEAAADTLEASRRGCRPPLLERRSRRPIRIGRCCTSATWSGAARPGLMALLRDEPQLLRMLGTLFGTSDRLADLLLRHPADVGAVGRRPGRARADARRAEAAGAVPAAAAEAGGDADATRGGRRCARVRRFQAEELLRIGLHDVAGEPRRGGGHGRPDELAEACLRAGDRRDAAGARATVRRARAGLTVLGLGQPGRARDALRLRPGPGVPVRRATARARTGIDHREWFARASRGSSRRWRRCWRRGGSTRSTRACARRASRGCWSRRGARSSATTATRRPPGSGSRCCARASCSATRTRPYARERQAELAAIAFDRPFDPKAFSPTCAVSAAGSRPSGARCRRDRAT